MSKIAGQSAFAFGKPKFVAERPTEEQKRYWINEAMPNRDDDCSLCRFEYRSDCGWCGGTRSFKVAMERAGSDAERR